MNTMVQESPPEAGKWELKELKPWHLQFCSMLAQGIGRETIAKALDITPTYVSMLANQPLIQKYIREQCQFATLMLEAQFAKGVQVIGEVMENGNDKERLQAVRLNAELTHRIGSGSGAPSEATDTNERLLRLADKLLALQEKMQPGASAPPIDGEFHESETGKQSSPTAVGPLGPTTQEDGNGPADPAGFGEEG